MADIETLLADTRYWLDQGSDPSAPPATNVVSYTKSGLLYWRNSSAVRGPILDETSHDVLDHTGLTGVGGGAAFVGNVVIAAPNGFTNSQASNAAPAASGGYAMPVHVPGAMKLRALSAQMQAAASGTYQWGLFNYASSATSCTKLAGGSGTLNGTGWQEIAATSAPVDVAAGNYMLIIHAPAANAGNMYRALGAAGKPMKSQGSYVWDDTPDITSGWSDNAALWSILLRGDLNGTNQW